MEKTCQICKSTFQAFRKDKRCCSPKCTRRANYIRELGGQIKSVGSNLVGKTFSRLLVTKKTEQRLNGNIVYECLCSCGNVALVPTSRLNNGTKKSCGCLHMDNARSKTTKHKTHGLHSSQTYKTWQSMLGRCYSKLNRSYPYYGAKGITVCNEWRNSFSAFLQDMGMRPVGMTIDRIDNTKGYEKNNCRWVTPKEQANNRTNNVKVFHNGQVMNLSEFAKEIGITNSSAGKKVRKHYCLKDGIFIKEQ